MRGIENLTFVLWSFSCQRELKGLLWVNSGRRCPGDAREEGS